MGLIINLFFFFKSKALHFSILSIVRFRIVYFILIFSQIISAQENLNIKYYTLEDGLSQVSINDMVKDNRGFVWIATLNGLNKFDGTNFKQFKFQKPDSTSLSGNYVTKLQLAHNGDIWIGTNGNGLNYYNADSNTFRRIALEGISNSNISAIETAYDDFVWVASSDSGLYKINGSDDTQERYQSDILITALHREDDMNLWLGDVNGGIYSTNSSGDQKPILKGWVQGNVQSFYSIGNELLIGSYEGLFRYNKETDENNILELEESGDFLTKHVVSFLKADDESVWVGTGRGLYLYNWKKDMVISKVEYEDHVNSGLTNNTVQSLLRISKDKILVGTANGLNLIDLESPVFKNISKDAKGSTLLNDNVIFSIHKNEHGLWVGTSDGGLNLIQNGKAYYFLDNKNDKNSIAGSVVRAIVEDKQNDRLWIATTRGLSLINLKNFNPEKPIFRNFYHDHKDINSLNTDFLKDITLDKQNNLWGAAYGYGIFRLELLEGDKAKITRYSHNQNDTNSLISDITQCIKTDAEGSLWIGTQNGLNKLEFKNSAYENPIFTSFQNENENTNSLSHNSVYDIIFDDKDDLWVGTRSGLNLFNVNGSFTSWTAQNQFTSDIVYSVQDDTNGNIWLGTNDGIVKYNPLENEFVQYGIEDGIQGKEFDIHARFRDTDGTIYLGGIDGLTYFNPKDINRLDIPQEIYFSELQVQGKEVTVQNNSKSILRQPLRKTQTLEFKHHQFPFYLKFSAIDFRIDKNVEYGYKLLPNDQEWNMLKDPQIQFLNLPSGKHTLLVNGFSRGKEWQKEPLKMELNVLPPWWSTIWAYAFYLAVASILGYQFYKFKLTRKLAVAESLRLKQLSELKSGLYTNITHEFRTPLTVILGMANCLKKNLKNTISTEDKNSLTMIERNGESLLEMVNELLDLAKIESGSIDLNSEQIDVVPFVRYLSESFNSLAATKNINLTVYSEIEDLQMDVDVNKLASIISNLLSNAIKFTGLNGKIIVHLNKTADGKSFIIKVKDNGVGLAKENLANLFDRFYQVENGAFKNQNGTGIGLSLTKEFVELMNGTIEVESTLGKGSTFTVELPVTNNAAKNLDNEITPELPIKALPQQIQEESLPEEEHSDLPLVLLIEDNIDVAHYLKTCLKENYKTIHAVDGIKGLEMAYKHIPDIIISDVMMPGKDGFEVCGTLKSDERTDHIPVILLTAKVTTEDRLAGLTHGADAYLAKPFNQDELFTRLDQLILVRKKLISKLDKNGFSVVLQTKAENPQTKFLKQVIECIHTHLDDADFGTTQLAREMHLSESQIYRKLKSITDKSTAIFIRSVRLQKAKELIKTTDKTISEIAYEVGFNDPSWFSRAFKKEFNLAPSDIHK